MIIEHVVDEVPTQIGTTLASSSSFVLEHVNDPPFVPNQTIDIESNSSTIIPSEPSSINSTQLTDITFPPVTPRFPNHVNNTNNQSIPRKRDITLHSK